MGLIERVTAATQVTLKNRNIIISICSHVGIIECPLTKWGEKKAGRI